MHHFSLVRGQGGKDETGDLEDRCPCRGSELTGGGNGNTEHLGLFLHFESVNGISPPGFTMM